MTYNEEVSKKLNDLLTRNYDAAAGYGLATEKVRSRNLKHFFTLQEQERYKFGHELKKEILYYGETPDKGTSWQGDTHRTWMNIKSTLLSNTEEAILEETVRGERTAIKEYNSIIAGTTLPPSTKNMITRHRNNILNALTRVNTQEELAS
jgi:uncharacterized protein (TIGR02284 family)